MKLQKIVFLAVSILLPFQTPAYSASRPVTLQEVAAQVKAENLTVRANAERIYQGKRSIRVARANLLPKLNIWKWVGAIIDWKSFVGVLEDLVPFLMPNNWIELNRQKLFYQAELQAEKALRANEIFSAKTLYLQALSDYSLLSHLRSSLAHTENVLSYVRTQEIFGEVPVGTSKILEIRALSLADDIRDVDLLVRQEQQELSLMLSLPVNDVVELVPIAMPRLEQWTALQAKPIVDTALRIAPELRQYDYLVHAASLLKKSAYFSVLGVSSSSRGVAGGIFDAYPLQDGLGFGLGPSVQIAKSQVRFIQIQKQGATETLARQIQVTVDQYNSDLERYQGVKQRLKLSEDSFAILENRLQLGGKVSGMELIEAAEQLVRAKTDELGLLTRAMQTYERVQRILLEEDYRQ